MSEIRVLCVENHPEYTSSVGGTTNSAQHCGQVNSQRRKFSRSLSTLSFGPYATARAPQSDIGQATTCRNNILS